MEINFRKIIPTRLLQKAEPKEVGFAQSLDYPNDIFERSAETEPKQFTILTKARSYNKEKIPVTVTQNPLDKAQIYKKVLNEKTGKIEKVPFTVDVATSKEKRETTFHFLDPDTKQEIGYVIIDNIKESYKSKKEYENLLSSGYLENFPKEGIVGERISIEFLENLDENKYGGIGKAADQIAIEFCLKNGIKPNIVSMAVGNSHAAHYNRGRRFFELDKDAIVTDYDYFVMDYGTNDPNKVIKQRIAETPKAERVNTADLGPLMMYMPQNVVKHYVELARKNPILH